MKVECIDDANRPETIPTSKWVKKGNTYTVVKAVRLTMQNGHIGFELAEIDLTGCAPFLFFSANRFRIKETVPLAEVEESEELLVLN